jgi:hypothetical protein
MKTVIPAQAGIQEMMPNRGNQFWTQACAGVTELPFLGSTAGRNQRFCGCFSNSARENQ